MGGLVNGKAFDTTFGIDTNTSSGTSLVALIVAICKHPRATTQLGALFVIADTVFSDEIGCFFGAVVTSFIGETLGRRRTILIASIHLSKSQLCTDHRSHRALLL